MRRPAAILLGIAALAVALLRQPVLHEAWLAAFLTWTGFSVGAIGALAMGHLLREDWLDPVRAPLEAAARATPLLPIMALPVLAGLDLLYPWAGEAPPEMPAARAAWFSPVPFAVRAVLFLALWCGAAWLLTRPRSGGKRAAALVLALLAATVPLAAQDWGLSRDPRWWGSLQGFAVWVEGIMAALAAAALVSALRGEMPDGATGPGEALERGLLTLGLTTIWLWFVQFIVVWMGNLPIEAGWYLRRAEGVWGVLKLGVAVPALILALLLAGPPRHARWRMVAVCLLLLVSHVAHLWWVVRPDAPLATPPVWLDLGAILVTGLAWGAWWRDGMAVRPGRPSPDPAPSPATASAR
jgi:hypothetical protein